MPKLSVYVQDELWNRAAAAMSRDDGSKPSNSALVQRALEEMLDGRAARTTALAEGAVLDRGRFDLVLNRVRDEARATYESGYALGLDIAESIGFDGLGQVFAEFGGDVTAFVLEARDEVAGAEEWGERLFGDDTLPGSRKQSVLWAGVDQAVRDLWEALRNAEPDLGLGGTGWVLQHGGVTLPCEAPIATVEAAGGDEQA